MQDIEHLKREVARINWWHTIDLGHGIVTPGRDRSAEKLRSLGLPEDLRDRTVLDIGAWDGFFSFEAERRGAVRVVATDFFCWHGHGWGTKAGFELARRALQSRVEDRDLDVYELSPETIGVFDLVLFLGVLYHLRNPWSALARVASVTADQLILETHVDLLHVRRPAIAIYPGAELKGDPTNWCGPNPAAIEAMLTTVGFRRVRLISGPSLARRIGRAIKTKLSGQGGLRSTLAQDRVVVHAWR